MQKGPLMSYIRWLNTTTNPLQIHRSNAGLKLKTNLTLKDALLDYKLNLKRLKHTRGSSAGLSLFIYTMWPVVLQKKNFFTQTL